MTREEAIANLNMISVAFVEPVTKEQRKLIDDTFDMAIKALEQEPCGVWVEIDDEPHEVWECDHCGFVIDGSGCIEPYEYRDIYKYCPNCGARMVEPQESDDEWNRVTMIDVDGNTHKVTFKKGIEDIGDYPDEIPNQFDNLTGSMNV